MKTITHTDYHGHLSIFEIGQTVTHVNPDTGEMAMAEIAAIDSEGCLDLRFPDGQQAFAETCECFDQDELTPEDQAMVDRRVAELETKAVETVPMDRIETAGIHWSETCTEAEMEKWERERDAARDAYETRKEKEADQ